MYIKQQDNAQYDVILTFSSVKSGMKGCTNDEIL